MQNSKFVLVCSVYRLSDLGLIKSLLDAEKIPYFVSNENFNTVYGPSGVAVPMDFMVPEDRIEEAKELLKDFIKPK